MTNRLTSRGMARVEEPRHYLDMAFGYYVSGRFALLNNIMIAPNIMHHAVELLIKYSLSKDEPNRDAAATRVRNTRGHKLDRLWEDYKAHLGRPDLSRFDQVIAELHSWEEIRYGGFPTGAPVGRGMTRTRPISTGASTGDNYTLVLDDIDELITSMIAASNINPAAVGSWYGPTEVPAWYARENNHLTPGLFPQAQAPRVSQNWILRLWSRLRSR
jgi:hypothetical protein